MCLGVSKGMPIEVLHVETVVQVNLELQKDRCFPRNGFIESLWSPQRPSTLPCFSRQLSECRRQYRLNFYLE